MSTYVEYSADISKYESAMTHMQGLTDKTLNFVKRSWLVAGASIFSFAEAWDMAKLAAQAQQEEQAFSNMAASFGHNADDMIGKLQEASAQTIDTSDLMAKAGQAMMAGLKPDEIVKFMEIARAAARLTGDTVAESFNKVTDSAMKSSDKQLKAMGIIVDTEASYQKYAKELGVTVERLTDVEKRQAFVNASLIAGEEGMNRIGAATKNAAEWFQTFDAFVKNLKESLGSGFVEVFKYVTVVFVQGAAALNRVLEEISGGLGWFFGILTKIPLADVERLQSWSTWMSDTAELLRERREELNAFTASILDMNKAGQAVGVIPMGAVGAERKPAGPNKEREALDRDLARIRMREFEEIAKAEWESWNVKEADITESLYEYRQLQLEIETGFSQKRLELNQWEHDATIQMIKVEADEEERIAKKREELTGKGINNMLENWMYFFQYFGKENKAAFTAFKAISIAQTIIDTYKAAQGAYSAMASIPYIGPALGVAAAAAAIAAGFARVSAISSTEPGGAAGGGAGGGGAIGTYSSSPITGLPTGYPAGAEAGTRTLTINIQGDYIGDEGYVELLAEKISKAVEDRDVRFIASNARFADALT